MSYSPCHSFRYITCYFIALLIAYPLGVQGQSSQLHGPDSLAISEGIILERSLDELTLYDYGQTQMKMKFVKWETSYGALYESRISLATPADLFKDPETTISLDLRQTRSFINKLHALLEIDSMKDIKLNRQIQINTGDVLAEGTAIWRINKEYSFFIRSDRGGLIHFELVADSQGKIHESDITGILVGEGNNTNYFTVNNYEDYRLRVGMALDRFRTVVQNAQNDPDVINRQHTEGVRGNIIDYSPLIENGYQVFKSAVHDIQNYQIISDVTLRRSPRRIPVNEYQGEFEDYDLVQDDQLNLYIQEILSFDVLIDELISILDEKQASGILDPEFQRMDDSIIARFSILK